jgi:quercetin dioxygenase-like cupin family protein
MRWLPITAALLATSTTLELSAMRLLTTQAGREARPRVVLDNPRVRVYRAAAGSLGGVDRGPAVVVSLDDGSGAKAGSAVWVEDAAAPPPSAPMRGSIVIVQPRGGTVAPPAAAPPPAAASKPGDAPFTGMSFNPIFDNDRVSAIRARMEVGAREGFHTHGSDTIVVHLSGGAIEDTANGATAVNRWKHGDVEFEGRGSSHSARNVGQAVDVVLVALKP